MNVARGVSTMTEAQEEFVQRLTACREEIVDASGELDAMEGHGPG
jgi:hypothetical protein